MAKYEFTQREVDERQKELVDIEEQLADALKQQRIAREFGDLSENTEYEVATNTAKRLQERREHILDELDNYVLVDPNNSPQIIIGCTVGITRIDESDNPVAEERILRLASQGNSVQKNTLGINSPLGKAILNGTDGIYTVQTISGGVRYNIRKISEEID